MPISIGTSVDLHAEWVSIWVGIRNSANKFLNRIQVVPLTSNIEALYPSEAYVKLKGKRSKAMADQLTTVSKLRFINRDGLVSMSDIAGIEQAIKTQLDLP